MTSEPTAAASVVGSTRRPAPRSMPQRMPLSAACSNRRRPCPMTADFCTWWYPVGSGPAVAPTSAYVNRSAPRSLSFTPPACHPRRTVRKMTTQSVAQGSGTFSVGGDLAVNRLGFGAMRLTGKGVWGPPADRDECVRVLRRAVELGVNFIDTADSYGPYFSEEIIHEALHPYEGLVIATKAGLLRTGPDVWVPLGNPSYLRQECEMSLRRLGVDTIDLYQLHRIDGNFPLADQLGELVKLRGEGKIRHIGLSEINV